MCSEGVLAKNFDQQTLYDASLETELHVMCFKLLA